MQEDNLLALQNSAKPIRNPFGFTFKTTWNSQPVELPSDGKWHTFVGRLADHIANRLWQKVTYKLHDREVSKLKIAGRDREARKFHLGDAMKNKVWMVITGQPHPKFKNGVLEAEPDMDFSELEKDMQAIDAQAILADQQTSVASVLQEASDAALRDLNMAGEGGATPQSIHTQGSVNMGAPVDPNAGSLPTQAISSTDVAPPPQQVQQAPALQFQQPQVFQNPAPEDAAAQATEFPSIVELD